MDFEWSTPRKSAFSFDPSFSKSLDHSALPQKRTAQTLDSSPSKSLNTSSKPFEPFPPVTNGNSGGSFLFSSTPARNLPEVNSKFPTADFYTPRKSSAVVDSSDIDVSSPGESPLPNNDSPDLPPRRTQYEKIQDKRKYRDAVRRRRIQKPKRYIVGSKYESESEDEESHRSLALSPSINEKPKTTNTGSFLTSDPDLPYVASGYVQLVFNMFLVGVALYLALAFIRTIQRDVNLKVEEYSAEILQEMAVCSKEYLENRCAPGTRVPAMEKACLAWEKCMNRDPTVVGRARVSAETFAEIINSFIEPISYKTMIFCLLAVFGSVFLSNFAFGLLRHREYQPPQRFVQYQQPPLPQTPVQMPNLVMMTPWGGNTRIPSPQRMASPKRRKNVSEEE